MAETKGSAPDPEWIAHSIELALKIGGAAEYTPPAATWDRLPELVHGITGDPPSGAVARPDMAHDAWQRWRQRLANATGHVQEGLIAAYYHADVVRTLEERILKAAEHHRADLVRYPGSTMGLRSRPLAYEYQAFLFAERRTLDYLAVAAAAFFRGAECHSIKDLRKAIAGKEPIEIGNRLGQRLEAELTRFSLSGNGYRSPRDRLAHWEAVDAGVFNFIAHPDGLLIRFVGAERPLDLDADQDVIVGVAAELHGAAERIEQLIFDVYRDLGIVR
jgi:hypothetical protein